ncbi:aquaporin [Escherichia coli]|nr:aquaporin [Escherichia coli]
MAESINGRLLCTPVCSWALEQLWFFWVVPIVGGIIGGLIYRTLLEKRN